MLKCFKGDKHIGKLKEIHRIEVNSPLGEDIVVRWCPNCGAVVIDFEVDERVSPGGVMKMRFPDFKHHPVKEA